MARIHIVYDFNDPVQKQKFEDETPNSNPLMPKHLQNKYTTQIELVPITPPDDMPW
jgi:hypothetical protein